MILSRAMDWLRGRAPAPTNRNRTARTVYSGNTVVDTNMLIAKHRALVDQVCAKAEEHERESGRELTRVGNRA